jgi:hypothetical protein
MPHLRCSGFVNTLVIVDGVVPLSDIAALGADTHGTSDAAVLASRNTSTSQYDARIYRSSS